MAVGLEVYSLTPLFDFKKFTLLFDFKYNVTVQNPVTMPSPT